MPPEREPWRSFALKMLVAAIALLGAIFLAGGAWLLWLGGSAYYLIAGIGLLASAILLLRERASGAWCFWLVLLGTVLWTWWESGADYWRWVPRLA